MKLHIVYDNTSSKPGLRTEWGFSCLMEEGNKTILFDTGGDGKILVSNMETLGLDPKSIDIIIISHIHRDHAGGLLYLLQKRGPAIIYLPYSFPSSFIEELRKSGNKVTAVQGPLEICSGIRLTGELGTHPKEQSLLMETEKGTILITGCAHPGITKIVKESKRITKKNTLLALGGFHLFGYSAGKIKDIISTLRELGVQYVAPCHCSGNVARELLKDEYGSSFLEIGAGSRILVDHL